MSEKKDIREELRDKKLLVDKLPKEEWRTFVWAVAEGESTTEAAFADQYETPEGSSGPSFAGAGPGSTGGGREQDST